ncbi:MAG TPA: hypothetical protein VK638_59285 [Edaphobacter sp.]|nr:hypothetical protein [Edaphobacter sp.]
MVAAFDSNHAVIAVDSRIATTDGRTGMTCKFVLHPHTLQVAAGSAGYIPAGGGTARTIFDISNYDSDFSNAKTAQQLEAAVTAWTETAKSLFQEGFKTTPNLLEINPETGAFLEALFFAVVDNGTVRAVRVTLIKAPMDNVITPKVKLVPLPDHDHPSELWFLGEATKTEQELLANRTSRAQSNQKILRDLIDAPTAKDLLNAERAFISLTAEWYPKYVGPPVDAAEITPTDGIVLATSKAECARKQDPVRLAR